MSPPLHVARAEGTQSQHAGGVARRTHGLGNVHDCPEAHVRPNAHRRIAVGAGGYRQGMALFARLTNIWYSEPMPAKTTSVALGKPYTDFARRKVESGEFGSTSEVVREAMRRFISQDAKREALDRALEVGLTSPKIGRAHV